MPVSILDNMGVFRKIDKSSMLQFCVDNAKHYRESVKNTEKIKLTFSRPENVIVAGMGGSGIGGELLKDWARSKAPFPIEVSKDYQLPAYAGKNTLVVLVSYSGETEESLSSFLDAVNRKCMVYCITSGGLLMKFAKKLSVPYHQIPSGMPPRAALPHLFVPLLKIMEKTGTMSKVSEDLAEAIVLLEKVSSEYAPEKTLRENFAKTLAMNLNGSAPAIYGFGVYRGVAMRWKQQFNENSKVPSKWEYFSELDHNEIVGWESSNQLAKDYAAVFIRDKAEPVEIRSRIETTQALMHPALSKMFEVWTQGKSDLAKMLSTICLGDFTSVYLAVLRKVDPTPVNTIMQLKAKIERSGIKERTIRELEKITAN